MLPLPASSTIIGRYIAYLAHSKRCSTIKQYLNIIRMLHLEHNFSHLYDDNYQVSSVMKEVKRHKGSNHNSKQVLTLQKIHAVVSFQDVSGIRDLQIWCALLLCFLGLLRMSCVTVPNKHSWDAGQILTKDDILVTPDGCIQRIRHSKPNNLRKECSKWWYQKAHTCSSVRCWTLLLCIKRLLSRWVYRKQSSAIVYIRQWHTRNSHPFGCKDRAASHSQSNRTRTHTLQHS